MLAGTRGETTRLWGFDENQKERIKWKYLCEREIPLNSFLKLEIEENKDDDDDQEEEENGDDKWESTTAL